jgi:hypothetical protein
VRPLSEAAYNEASRHTPACAHVDAGDSLAPQKRVGKEEPAVVTQVLEALLQRRPPKAVLSTDAEMHVICRVPDEAGSRAGLQTAPVGETFVAAHPRGIAAAFPPKRMAIPPRIQPCTERDAQPGREATIVRHVGAEAALISSRIPDLLERSVRKLAVFPQLALHQTDVGARHRPGIAPIPPRATPKGAKGDGGHGELIDHRGFGGA